MATNALSFDLEEWYHPEAIRQSGLQVTRFPQVEQATTPILDLLRRYGVKATFFAVGEVAADHPKLIERILDDGHELGFHGWTHDPLWVMTAQSFAAEIDQFWGWRDRNFAGVPILGFRAPTFSLDHTTAWAVSILMGHGFRYDSSIFPARTPLYGVPDAPLAPYFIDQDDLSRGGSVNDLPPHAGEGLTETPLPRLWGRGWGTGSELLEIPMSVFPIGKLRIGFTGGLYLRALPLGVIKQMIVRTNRAGRAAMIYIHPWETYAGTPRLPLKFSQRQILYYGLPSFIKLERLLQSFSFDTVQAVFQL